MELLADAFKQADHDHNASLDAQEVSDLVHALHLSMTVEEVLAEIHHEGGDLKHLQKWWEKRESKIWSMTMSFFVLFLLYPGLSTQVFDALSCRELADGMSVLRVHIWVGTSMSDGGRGGVPPISANDLLQETLIIL